MKKKESDYFIISANTYRMPKLQESTLPAGCFTADRNSGYETFPI